MLTDEEKKALEKKMENQAETKELEKELTEEEKQANEDIKNSKEYKEETKENKKTEAHEAVTAVHAAKAMEHGKSLTSPLEKLQGTLAKGAIAAEGRGVENPAALAREAKIMGVGLDMKSAEKAHHQRDDAAHGLKASSALHQAASPVSMPKAHEPQHAQAGGESQASEHKSAPDAPKPEGAPELKAGG